MALNYLASISHYIPELLVCFTMGALILIEATYGNDDKGSSKKMFYWSSMIGLLCALIYQVKGLGTDATHIFTKSVVMDHFSGFAKIVMILSTAGAIYLSKVSKDLYEGTKAEFGILAMGILVGGMLLASANNMLIFFIGIETLSILSYAMAALKKNDERSTEAGLKYVLYGGATSGMMLFGMSHIFGTLGTINFSEMIPMMSALTEDQTLILIPSFLLFFVGIGYKIACVPFHMWSPDVYEGSPLPVTAFFSLVPKFAGIAAFTRLTQIFFAGDVGMLKHSWIFLLMVVASLTMTVGNVSAIGQRSIKRMLAFSSISHAGVMMLGAIVLGEMGATAILFYAVTYLFMTLVAFYIASFIQDHYGNDHIDRFAGLIKKHPFAAIAMTITMFSLAGLPPLAGFVAKFNILAAVVQQKYYVLAVITAVNSVISLYYYMKVVRVMVLKDAESDEKVAGLGFVNQLIIGVYTAPVLIIGIFWQKLLSLANGALLLIK
ncbi:NADH-quinone oxidoreductase subunit N [Halobacteriovorax sp. DPLXC-1]|uniref:NADH-quinone oxidoreductase subunit N n=1 Tax=unclassified Halobacteriovorax TaxID=2639665 RepID=UPI002FF226A3